MNHQNASNSLFFQTLVEREKKISNLKGNREAQRYDWIVAPFLQSEHGLGWRLEQLTPQPPLWIDENSRNFFQIPKRMKYLRPDVVIGLETNNRPSIIVEVKDKAKSIEDLYNHIGQLNLYCLLNRSPWALLTDGYHWILRKDFKDELWAAGLEQLKEKLELFQLYVGHDSMNLRQNHSYLSELGRVDYKNPYVIHKDIQFRNDHLLNFLWEPSYSGMLVASEISERTRSKLCGYRTTEKFHHFFVRSAFSDALGPSILYLYNSYNRIVMNNLRSELPSKVAEYRIALEHWMNQMDYFKDKYRDFRSQEWSSKDLLNYFNETSFAPVNCLYPVVREAVRDEYILQSNEIGWSEEVISFSVKRIFEDIPMLNLDVDEKIIYPNIDYND